MAKGSGHRPWLLLRSATRPGLVTLHVANFRLEQGHNVTAAPRGRIIGAVFRLACVSPSVNHAPGHNSESGPELAI